MEIDEVLYIKLRFIAWRNRERNVKVNKSIAYWEINVNQTQAFTQRSLNWTFYTKSKYLLPRKISYLIIETVKNLTKATAIYFLILLTKCLKSK